MMMTGGTHILGNLNMAEKKWINSLRGLPVLTDLRSIESDWLGGLLRCSGQHGKCGYMKVMMDIVANTT